MEIQEDSDFEQDEVSVLVQTEIPMDIELHAVNLEFDTLNINKDPQKALYFSVIQTAVEDYLFFGIRKNTCNVEDFFSAYNYLFKTKSADRSTWQTDEKFDDVQISPEDMRLLCFDVHYDYAGLGTVIKKNVLLNLLKTKRQKNVNEHYKILERRMNIYRRSYQIETGKKPGPVNYDEKYLKNILIDPTEVSLAKLYFGE